MREFRDIDELRVFLRNDRDEVSLCPLRFVSVDSMEMWVNVKKLLLSMSKSHICLSQFCSLDDTTPNMSRFKASLKSVKESVCASPLSEYLRVNPDVAKKTVMDLLAMDYRGNIDGRLRIYIPMYRMKSILQTLNGVDVRKKDCIILLSTGEDSDYSLTVMQKDLKASISGNEIYGFKQYLQYWEQNPDKPLILHTENAIHFNDRVFFDNVRVIVSAFDLLKEYHGLPANCREEDGCDEYWTRLAASACREQTFENACCRELLINKYTVALFEKWQDFNNFNKWLLWLWTRTKPLEGYLGRCIAKSSCVKEFPELLYNEIIDVLNEKNFAELYDERRELLTKMQLGVPNSFTKMVEALPPMDKIRVLSDASSPEREAIFKTLKDIPPAKQNEAIDILKMSYPHLACYLQNDDECAKADLPKELADYFAQYRWNKAANILPAEFMERVKSIATEKGVPILALKSRNMIVTEEYDEHTAIIFADGMGVEYVNYICHALQSLTNEGYKIRTEVGYCNLPSITEINKDFLEGRRVFEQLPDPDEMKHGSNVYPQTIENELRFLYLLKEKVRSAFSEDVSRVILTTDHGTSRMAVLVRSTEFDKKIPPKGHNIYKYGRYCEGCDMAEELEGALEYDGKLIFADYTRFEQKGAPTDETHGGASPEEWLVPIIIVDNPRFRKSKTNVTIIPPENAIDPDTMTKMVTVRFSLKNYSDEDVSVRVYGKKIVCRKIGGQYEFKCQPGKAAEVEARVFVASDEIGKFSFVVKHGLTSNKKFDL